MSCETTVIRYYASSRNWQHASSFNFFTNRHLSVRFLVSAERCCEMCEMSLLPLNSSVTEGFYCKVQQGNN